MQTLKRLFGQLGPYWKILVVTCVLLVLQTGLSLLPPLFQRAIVDQVIGGRDLGRLGHVEETGDALRALGWCYGCCNGFRRWCWRCHSRSR